MKEMQANKVKPGVALNHTALVPDRAITPEDLSRGIRALTAGISQKYWT
jgi:hypothetical protein